MRIAGDFGCGVAMGLAFVLIAAGGVWATDYYVDGSAPSGGTGTLADPFDRIQQGLSRIDAGFPNPKLQVQVGTGAGCTGTADGADDLAGLHIVAGGDQQGV